MGAISPLDADRESPPHYMAGNLLQAGYWRTAWRWREALLEAEVRILSSGARAVKEYLLMLFYSAASAAAGAAASTLARAWLRSRSRASASSVEMSSGQP